jgi:hypothetical protein
MSKKSNFVTILQTTVLYLRPKLEIGLDLICEGMSLPEETIPGDYRKAAMELWEHFVNRKPPPDWFAVHREQVKEQERANKDLVTIAVNSVDDADAWWMHAEACSDSMPKQCIDLVCGRGVRSIAVPRHIAEHFRDWAAGIPGWEYRPFCFFDAKGAPLFEGV